MKKKGNLFLLLFVLKGNNRRRGHTSAGVKPLGWQLNVLEHYYINKFPKKIHGVIRPKSSENERKKKVLDDDDYLKQYRVAAAHITTECHGFRRDFSLFFFFFKR